MTRLTAVVQLLHGRAPFPSMVMVDAQTVKGGRYGPTFHEILGLPIAARADSARPHDVVAARELLRDRLTDLPRVQAIVGDRAYRGLVKLAERKHVTLDIKAQPRGTTGFTPLWPLYNAQNISPASNRRQVARRCRCKPASTASPSKHEAAGP